MTVIQVDRSHDQNSRAFANGPFGSLPALFAVCARGFEIGAHIAWRVVREWDRRSVSRQELLMLDEGARRDLGYRYDFDGEVQKPFWEP